jgi:lipoprotein-anchoring transpeptidase ErfK/SrfK
VFGSGFGRFVRAVFASSLLIASAGTASASVVAVVDVSTQRMTVTVDGASYAVWKVSTARRGYYTPRGSFGARYLKRMHYSRKYDNSPMPYSVFFYGGYAIHGTNYVRRLGSPASHGCIRLHTANAANLYYLIKRYGQGNTRIRVVN